MATIAALAIAILALALAAAEILARRRRLRKRLERCAYIATRAGAQPTETALFRTSIREHAALIEWFRDRYPLAPLGPTLLRLGASALAAIVLSMLALRVLRISTTEVVELAIVVTSALGAVHLALEHAETKARQAFVDTLPDAVDQLVRLTSVGTHPIEGIIALIEDTPEPLRSVFAQMRDAMYSGLDADAVLDSITRRIKLTDFTMFCTTLRLQRRTGAQIGQTLRALSDTLRDRVRAKASARAKTSQTRATIAILFALPFVTLTAQLFSAPEKVMILFTEEGAVLLRWAAALLTLGLLVVIRLSAIRTSE